MLRSFCDSGHSTLVRRGKYWQSYEWRFVMRNSARSFDHEPFSSWSIPVTLGLSVFFAVLFGVGIIKLVEHAVLIAA